MCLFLNILFVFSLTSLKKYIPDKEEVKYEQKLAIVNIIYERVVSYMRIQGIKMTISSFWENSV